VGKLLATSGLNRVIRIVRRQEEAFANAAS
jgi:hypothetical protein